MELKKEAGFFGDIIVAPYMDSYDLVVLKTVATCEYGVSFSIQRVHRLQCHILYGSLHKKETLVFNFGLQAHH